MRVRFRVYNLYAFLCVDECVVCVCNSLTVHAVVHVYMIACVFLYMIILCVCVVMFSPRLAEIAHSLLKLAPYDSLTMESRGLRRYVTGMLPITDWSSEAVRPALILILKRLDRMFNKIHKMPTLRCARPQALCSRSVAALRAL